MVLRGVPHVRCEEQHVARLLAHHTALVVLEVGVGVAEVGQHLVWYGCRVRIRYGMGVAWRGMVG